jgi:hypothetical protein
MAIRDRPRPRPRGVLGVVSILCRLNLRIVALSRGRGCNSVCNDTPPLEDEDDYEAPCEDDYEAPCGTITKRNLLHEAGSYVDRQCQYDGVE